MLRLSLSRTIKAACCVSALLLCSQYATACPKIGNFIDFNCDEKISIVGLGDSFISGKGDLEFPKNPGYIGRLARRFTNAKFTKLGFPGITSHKLLATIKEEFERRPKKKIAKAIGMADILIIDVGRNDFFEMETAEFTVTTLRRLGLFIQQKTKQIYKSSPLLVFAFLAPTPRRFQEPEIMAINELMMKVRSDSFPVYLRFDLLDVSLISVDGIHPAATGHQQLADLAAEYLRDEAPKREKLLRTDLDEDGIFDQFEKVRFKTSPTKADSDNDSLGDGDEVFTFRTNPKAKDTDSDGYLDGDEISVGSDPLLPDTPPTPTPTPTATETPAAPQ